jgi:hypothetical protein
MRFAVPYFDVFDPRLPDHGIPMAVRGTMTFNITDYQGFIKLNRLVNFDHEQFRKQIKDALTKYIKGVVMNVPQEMGIPVVQMERQILSINDKVVSYLKPRIEEDFGVNLKGLDIGALEIDKESRYYKELRHLTAENTGRTMDAQTALNIKNLQDTQQMNLKNMEETMRIQREEAQRAQRLQTETNFMGAHALDQQTDVLKTGAQNMGNMGSMDSGAQGGHGMNPGGVMAGMMMWFGINVPVGVLLYYDTSAAWGAIQQTFITRRVLENAKKEHEERMKNKPVEVDVVRKEHKPRQHKKS